MQTATRNESTTSPARPGDRRRKMLAILAGGLVLGVGAAVTLAVWNDSEFATGTFGSGQFELEGSLDGTAFSSSETAPGKPLAFAVDADLLSPGAVVYAPFAVQLSSDSTYEASVDLASTTSGTIGAELTYSLYDVGATFGATCSAATPPSGTALVTDQPVASPTPAAVFELTAVTDPVNLCFVVTASSTLPAAQTGTVTWEFLGESTDPLP
ncbi:putative ribosomally synthesized peptide with SipW-like signal peptide [Agromyces sp. 3263]|uniref:SipW-dependent-type signal peptide-containing protein n=1 Tax=Agromyces sp. 3263 TaxID=2817750 RepID=UPI00285B9BF4|nr:SipW-dependent-type signal peptide-containing protein [Agromyces sp. 3263]MDR6905956.1 putative ribosomally synthesized peptide with SipW-like signal peptide [Agromyces sp. 3263]